MPDNIHHLPEKEIVKINLDGIRELKQFIRESYEKVNFVFDLHETPLLKEPDHAQFGIFFPAWNQKLEKVLEQFELEYRKKVWVIGTAPFGYITYHSADIEYYSKIKQKDGILSLTKTEGLTFLLDLIDYLKKNYLRVSQGPELV